MQAMSANAGAPRAPQRSPFAIQELLGLSDNREPRERYFESRDDRVLNLSERERYAPQFPLPASVASRVAYAAAFNAQAAVAAAFLPGPPLLHPPPGMDLVGRGVSELAGPRTCSTMSAHGFPQIKSPYSPSAQPHLTGKWLECGARGVCPSCPPSPPRPFVVPLSLSSPDAGFVSVMNPANTKRHSAAVNHADTINHMASISHRNFNPTNVLTQQKIQQHPLDKPSARAESLREFA
ncbi:unnamed protein product [Chilo suppressalis]|uniref:Uncharacterized protein n=1 Tax=Chilo suppressalis TaxID=168631 RepID=A0ABN8B1A6_CHISP|nr:unnamed protein product [Chilo suppressalis]